MVQYEVGNLGVAGAEGKVPGHAALLAHETPRDTLVPCDGACPVGLTIAS